MEIEHAIFQGLGSFGKEAISKWLWEFFRFLFGKILKKILNGCREVS